MKYGFLFLVSLFILAACDTTNVYPTKVVEVPVASEPKVVEKIVTKIDCASIDGAFEQVGDTCVSICVACLNSGGQCLDTNANGYGDTCVTPVPACPMMPYYLDLDGDGYGDTETFKMLCSGVGEIGWVDIGGDCSDTNAQIHPGVEEICDDVDQNCDGDTDSDLKAVYSWDTDGDGFGDPYAKITLACKVPEGMVIDKSDCNDNSAKIHPGADEMCGDLIDNNCSGQVDEMPCITYEELCGDNIDNNKDGATDEGCDCVDVKKPSLIGNGYADWCNKCTGACKTLPDIEVTKESYKLVLVWGGTANPNWFYKNTLKYKQETNPGLSGTGYVTTEVWDSWSGVDFVKDTFVAIDLDPAVMYIRFNMMQYPGTWEICNAAKVTDTFVDFNALNLPTIYVVKNGVWENVTSKVGMQVALDVVNGGKTPKSASPSGYPVPNYCSAYITF